MREEDSLSLVKYLIDCFINQENLDQLQLIIINMTYVNNENENLSEKINTQYNNIFIINLENPNEYIKNLDTDYIMMVNLNDKYKMNYSKFCIEYLDNKPNSDIIFSSFKNMNIIINTNNQEKDTCLNKYKKGMFFIEDVENIYLKQKSKMPHSGYVFRKSMIELLELPFYFMKNKDMYEYFIRNHLNIFCISENPLFISYYFKYIL